MAKLMHGVAASLHGSRPKSMDIRLGITHPTLDDDLGMLAGPATELKPRSTGHAIGGWCLRLCPHWRDVPRTRDYDHHGGYE